MPASQTRCLRAAALACAIVPAALSRADSVILIPDATQDKVWAFSAWDGSLITEDYVPEDPYMSQVRLSLIHI